jgi:hypothetical protein
MKIWKKLDVAGRIIVMLAIGWQLTALSTFVSERQRGDIAYLMENQAYIALMVKRLATPGSPSEIGNDVADAYGNITLYSEWQQSIWNEYISVSTGIFVLGFLLGSTLSIVGRYLELKEP